LTVKAGYKTYLWSTNGQNNSITIDDTYPVGKHEISIIVTGENGCQSFDTIQVEIKDNIGIDEPLFSSVKIWPNPSKSIFNLSSSTINGKVELDVYSSHGLKIISKEIQLTSGTQARIDLSAYGDGLYFLSIKQENLLVVKKVVLRK